MIDQIATQKMAELINKLDEGTLHKITSRAGFRKSVMGDKTGASPLPTLKGIHNETELNLDFTPFPEGGHFANIEVKVLCPFKMVLTLENREVKSMKFKTTYGIAVAEIQIGQKEFDEKFFIETLEIDAVKAFLEDETTRNLIVELGDFDQFTFQYKHLKLVYYVEDMEKMDTETLFRQIDILTRIAARIKK